MFMKLRKSAIRPFLLLTAALTMALGLGACTGASVKDAGSPHQALAQTILSDQRLDQIEAMACDLIRTGFTAGEVYGEVWIRDYNTFMELACHVYGDDTAPLRQNLLVFFHFQGEDGNIIDGFIPADKAQVSYEFIHSETMPQYLGHKNTVETDQESSLLQAVHVYLTQTGDHDFLDEMVAGQSVLRRLEMALEFLMNHRYSAEHGLLWGATTVDWGDVQPEHPWGVMLDENSHLAIDIYDNAMFILAIQAYEAMAGIKEVDASKWSQVREDIARAVRQHLWDGEAMKFRPHIYLDGSPFPEDFDEDAITYHGGTAVAIQAGLLTAEEIDASLERMRENVRLAGAASIGLTVYPAYPEGFFQNPSLAPYSYQNGGDWTWFGARMIQALIANDRVADAWIEAQPMLDRVLANEGFYEWYSIDNKPQGSGSYRGSAGVLYQAIGMFRQWAHQHGGAEAALSERL